MDEVNVQGKPKSNSSTIGLVVIALIVAGAIGLFVVQSNKETADGDADDMTVSPTTAQAQTSTPTMMKDGGMMKDGSMMQSSYKDGTYTVVGNYTSPGGAEELGVTVTLKDGVITETSVEPKATRPNSVKFQGIFAENYKPLVEGKKIDEVKLDKVSGSSLAPKGFNDALEKIKTEAAG